MRISDFIRQFAQLFTSRRPPVVQRRTSEPEEPRFADSPPPGYIPIETQISGQQLDGTSRWVGQDARVVESPAGEVVTCERLRTVMCGCRHLVYSIQEKTTAAGLVRGIGGSCSDCAREGEDLVRRNLVSPSQAEALQFYCSQCASHCDACGRQSLCRRHTSVFTDTDGRQWSLCPDCRVKADRKKFFKQTVGLFIRILADDDKPTQRE
jgi:hypothetical protein